MLLLLFSFFGGRGEAEEFGMGLQETVKWPCESEDYTPGRLYNVLIDRNRDRREFGRGRLREIKRLRDREI